MAQQSLIWTALPNGYTHDGEGLRLSVMVSPRLDSQADPQRLDSFFPEWEDWPTTVRDARFTITYNGGNVAVRGNVTTGPDRIDDRLGTADSNIWKALFDGAFFVRGFQYQDLSNNQVLSYGTVAMAGFVRDLYADLARTADDNLPLISAIADSPGWRDLIDRTHALDRTFWSDNTGMRSPSDAFRSFVKTGRVLAPPGDRTELLARFQLFHTPSATPRPRREARADDSRIEANWLEYEQKPMPTPAEVAKQLDFHQIVAAMNSYPTLLRRLGLVVDLVLRRDAFPRSANGALSVKVEFADGALRVPKTNDASPETRTLLSDRKFQAVSDSGAAFQIRDGLLDIDPKRFELLQVDVDGAGLKVMNFARSLGRRDDDSDQVRAEKRADSVTRIEDEAGAPSLRNAGLMLVHNDRATFLKNRFNDNKLHNQDIENQFQGAVNGTSLHAEDLVRGYHVDIWDSVGGVWRSLCRRTASYDLGNGAATIEPAAGEEESVVRLAASKTTDPASAAGNVVCLHEALVSWTGWSLAAPPPGRSIDKKDSFDTTTTESEAELPPGLKFKSRFRPVDGSLPRLRFGRSYWIRARAVDLAGNALAPQPKDYGLEAPKQRSQPYLRYEPVAAPILALLRRVDTISTPREGESMALVAIRSFNDTPADNLVLTNQVSRRIAAPPRASIREAEQHGKFDAAGRVDSSTYDMLANQKDLDAGDPNAAIREVALPMQGPPGSQPDAAVFAVYEDGRPLTYLPDPLALEVAVRIFDHPNIADSEIITIPLYSAGTWPEARPFEIEVFDDPAAVPFFDAATRRLRVPLPKAVRAKIRLSMKMSGPTLEAMGVFAWLSDADKAAQRGRALDGQHWMLTPWRVVEVVHAVQRPLLAPEIASISVLHRGLGVTSARPAFVASCSIASTDRADLLAEWHEPIDDPSLADSAATQIDRQRRDVAFPIKIVEPQRYALRLQGHKAGGYPDHSIQGPDLIGVNIVNSDLIANPAHEFHDTRYRRIEYWLEATTRFREFLPVDLLTQTVGGTTMPVETNIKVTGPRAVTWVANSAPPPAPHVLYVIPTFGWTRTTDAQGTLSSWRRGGGLRVYLDRPWNVSGYGEMLGVVLPPANFAGDPDNQPLAHPFKKYVTQWGSDPVWDSAFLPGIAPRRTDFPLARTTPDQAGTWLPLGAPITEADQRPGTFTVTGLLPPSVQSGDAAVEVAPHDVFYDADRQLWYCDIEIEPGAAYFPFIRLALARYQPTSEAGAHLSNIVLADIMALTMDRWLSVTPTQDARKRHIAVFGVTYDQSSGHYEAARAPSMSLRNVLNNTVENLEPAKIAESSVVDVWVERLDESRGEDFGWRPVDAEIAPTGQAGSGSVGGLRGEVRIAVAAQINLSARLQARALLAARDFEKLATDRLIDHVRLFQPLWEGDVTLPVNAPAGARHRLVIAEYEEYLVDDSRPYDKVPTKKDRRLVFVEHIELV
jgi:hypothetical protein